MRPAAWQRAGLRRDPDRTRPTREGAHPTSAGPLNALRSGAGKRSKLVGSPLSVATISPGPSDPLYPSLSDREGGAPHQRRPVKCIALRGREAFEAGGIPVIGCHDFARTVGSSLAKSLSLPFLQTTTFNSPGW